MYHHKEKATPPPFLHYYRGFDEYASDILRERRLFLKSPADFNDPFDCNAHSMKKYVGRACRNRLKKELKNRTISEEQKNRIRIILKQKLYNEPAIWDGIIPGFQSEILNFGIFSFTERPDNFLMWSHYADSHNGLCFGFETRYMPTDLTRLMKVRYRNRRLRLWFYDQKAFHLVFNVKSAVWKYEKEWRTVVPKRARTYVPFDHRALHVVVCGVGMADDKLQSVATYLGSYTNSPILYKAKRHSSDYGVVFDQVHYKR